MARTVKGDDSVSIVAGASEDYVRQNERIGKALHGRMKEYVQLGESQRSPEGDQLLIDCRDQFRLLQKAANEIEALNRSQSPEVAAKMEALQQQYMAAGRQLRQYALQLNEDYIKPGKAQIEQKQAIARANLQRLQEEKARAVTEFDQIHGPVSSTGKSIVKDAFGRISRNFDEQAKEMSAHLDTLTQADLASDAELRQVALESIVSLQSALEADLANLHATNKKANEEVTPPSASSTADTVASQKSRKELDAKWDEIEAMLSDGHDEVIQPAPESISDPAPKRPSMPQFDDELQPMPIQSDDLEPPDPASTSSNPDVDQASHDLNSRIKIYTALEKDPRNQGESLSSEHQSQLLKVKKALLDLDRDMNNLNYLDPTSKYDAHAFSIALAQFNDTKQKFDAEYKKMQDILITQNTQALPDVDYSDQIDQILDDIDRQMQRLENMHIAEVPGGELSEAEKAHNQRIDQAVQEIKAEQPKIANYLNGALNINKSSDRDYIDSIGQAEIGLDIASQKVKDMARKIDDLQNTAHGMPTEPKQSSQVKESIKQAERELQDTLTKFLDLQSQIDPEIQDLHIASMQSEYYTKQANVSLDNLHQMMERGDIVHDADVFIQDVKKQTRAIERINDELAKIAPKAKKDVEQPEVETKQPKVETKKSKGFFAKFKQGKDRALAEANNFKNKVTGEVKDDTKRTKRPKQ